ncbi:MAG TPA: phosphoribosyl-AMP cyclohydrolase [Chthoniobacterales bacterium]|jgi:phosphoribosyl-AMP cyclohydrolase
MNLKYNSDGLIPAIVQEASDTPTPTGRVLMMAWMNEKAVADTLATGKMHYWSRSRQKSWFKGESSGHTQEVVRWFADCDRDTLLFEVRQNVAACHTGHVSCFFQELDPSGNSLPVHETKAFDPDAVYHP